MSTIHSRSLEKYIETHFIRYINDNTINEICYNGTDKIYLQDNLQNWKEEDTTLNYDKALAFATACAAYKGVELQPSQPIMSAALPTGERVQIVIPPASKKNKISITIRKPSRVRYTVEDFAKQGFFEEIIHETDNKLSKQDLELKSLYDNGKNKEFLCLAAQLGKNIILAGETGSSKTTFMKALIDFIPVADRIITIEDTEEISFVKHQNFVQLFYPDTAKEGDAVTSSSLLKSCLRMKPDRILLAELRGGEAYDYLNVLSSGHGGTITSLHAGGIKQTFKRLTMMAIQNPQAQKIPHDVLEKDFFAVIDVVVHITVQNSKRRISDIYYKGA